MAGTTVFRALTSYAQGEINGIAQGVRSYTGPASYAAGGFAVALATDESLNNAPYLVMSSPGGDASGTPGETTNVLDYVAYYDYANLKVIVYDPADASEVSDATNLSGVTFRLAFWSAV